MSENVNYFKRFVQTFFGGIPIVCDETTVRFYDFLILPLIIVGRDSSVVIATPYVLDDPGIESRWRRDFPHPSRSVLGPIQSPIQWVPSLFVGGKAEKEWH